MPLRTIILTGAAFPLGYVAASAQSDPMHMLYLAAANQLGVIEYCRSYGWADDETVDAQKKIASALPASSDLSGLSDAENDGKQGTLVVNGNRVTLAEAASSQGTMAQTICMQLGSTVKAVATNLRNIPSASSGTLAAPQ
jgi:hypothetical protein